MRLIVFRVAMAIIACLGLVACSPDSPATPDSAASNAGTGAPKTEPLTLAITPTAGTGGAPISTEVGITVQHGTVSSVRVVRAGTNEPLAGALREDGTSWVPAAPLAFGATYEATVTATGQDGHNQTQSSTFSTMGRPGREIGTGMYLFDGQAVGVAMPVVIEFDTEVPEEARAGVQRRLFVTTNPPQPGVWHWASGRQVWYRAPVYWQPGTTISVRAALAGVPMGNGSYGDTDRSATATVGNKVFMTVDNATKEMQVYVDDQLVRTVPVSLGKPSTPSSSGFMVLMSKEPTRTFDTRNEPDGGYVVDVNWAMRLTWGGEFVHAAPWSVGDQGHRNVSHGCVNMSDSNSRWLFDTAHLGDPIIVKGTEVALVNGNGWTAWNESWAEYVKGSALPVPPALAAAPGVDPLTGALPPPAVAATPKPPEVPAAQPTSTR
jgi:lipoprotein-anchoring transpeptidase ErfK/SrfK